MSVVRRRRDTGDRTAPRLAGTVARLVQFTVVTRIRSGRTKSSVIRVLTTLLDHAAFSAAGMPASLTTHSWPGCRSAAAPPTAPTAR